MKKNILPEIIVPNMGAKAFRCYGDKGYLIVFVYSNKGNFVLKGFAGEVNKKIDELITNGYKFYYRYNYLNKGKVRYSNVAFWNKDIWFGTPEKRTSKYGSNLNKFEFRRNSQEWNEPSKVVLSLKRLPKYWIPEFETL
jgi:hypothetical protein